MYSMADVVRQVDAEREALSEGALFKWLSDEAVDGHRRLSFLPSMLYYLMGFKDVLATLSCDNPREKLEHHINAYCLEDADHWRWYLTDLDKLGFDLTCWGETISDWCNQAWSPETEINRRTIFHLIHFAMSNRHPLYRLALILVFEATGVVFIGHTRKAAIALGMDEELQYLGREHYEEEAAHSVKPDDVAHHALSSELYGEIHDMIEALFIAEPRRGQEPRRAGVHGDRRRRHRHALRGAQRVAERVVRLPVAVPAPSSDMAGADPPC